MIRKELLGLSMLLLGVACLALAIFQFNSYYTLNGLASTAKANAYVELEKLKNDPTQLSALGLTKEQLDQAGPQALSLLEQNVKAITEQANALVPAMLLDAVLGMVFLGAGIHLASERRK